MADEDNIVESGRRIWNTTNISVYPSTNSPSIEIDDRIAFEARQFSEYTTATYVTLNSGYGYSYGSGGSVVFSTTANAAKLDQKEEQEPLLKPVEIKILGTDEGWVVK